jgi:hypothetical protein
MFYATKGSDSLTGNYLLDNNFLYTKGYSQIDIQKNQLTKLSKIKTSQSQDRIYTKNRKLYAYRIIEGDYY